MAIKAKKVQPAKTAAIEEAKKVLSEYNDFIFADFRGLTVEQITTKEEIETTNDEELVAVITAAIAASSQTSGDGFVVRSIKRVQNRNWK